MHMMLEAASLDLGSAWISYFDEDKARILLELLSGEDKALLYLAGIADVFKYVKNIKTPTE